VNYVFGPVPSRRLGKSLGIDPIPLKTCNWNCVYCQLGRTRPLTKARRSYIPPEDILAEVQQALAAHQPGEIDWITFVGSGEPTLHCKLGWLIREVKALTDLPVAVITNGALLSSQKVRMELFAADAVLPSLDAGNPYLYRKINRPWPRLTLDGHVHGLADLRQDYPGQLWIEVMLVKGLNDSPEALRKIAAALKEIKPDQVHLLLPDRPPSENWVQPADETGVQQAHTILSEVAWVIQPASGHVATHSTGDLQSAMMGVITRHPMPAEELCAALGCWTLEEVQRTLDILLANQKAQVVLRHGKQFWSAAGAYYAAEIRKQEPAENHA
jgi:wyosine [tRNA(Phe)-imidazoG37] synthetase (radical SAM superfamily)